jgi:hypothetical protein
MGAAAAQLLGAIAAECAFEGANHRVRRGREQVLAAAFAVGAQFEHISSLSMTVLEAAFFADFACIANA